MHKGQLLLLFINFTNKWIQRTYRSNHKEKEIIYLTEWCLTTSKVFTTQIHEYSNNQLDSIKCVFNVGDYCYNDNVGSGR